MVITSAKYMKDLQGNNASVKATIDGQIMHVPMNTSNRHYEAILEWVDAGNSITAAD